MSEDHGGKVAENVEKITELREAFFRKLKNELALGHSKEFHPADINRIKNSDAYLKRFLDHHEQNFNDALKMMWETCEWRRDFGTNDLNENTVRRDYLEDGVCFGYGKDKNGKKLFVIKSKLHVKGSKNFAELQRCIVYWFERLERESHGDQITLFFDMVDAGLSNIDMDLTKYLINLFKHYYPNFLNLILILEMPWILNAAFTIIKSWLPARAISKIKMVKKSTLKDYVDLDDALKSWGGNNDYSFVFVPETPQRAQTNGNVDKKVHFQMNQGSAEQMSNNAHNQSNQDDIDRRMLSTDPEVLTFRKMGRDVIGTIKLSNSSDKHLTFKIKTTTLEKFKVRPSKGILPVGQTIAITIILLPNMGRLSCNDRFLVMALPVSTTNMSNEEIVEFWMNNVNNAEQHRIICRDENDQNLQNPRSIMSSTSNTAVSERLIGPLISRISRIEEEQMKIQNDMTRLRRLALCVAIVIGLFIAYLGYPIKNLAIINTDIRGNSDATTRHEEI